MKRYLLFVIVVFNLFLSCRNTKQGDLLEIPVDIDQINPLKLSEITEEISAIELELTNESMMSPAVNKVIISENEIFVANRTKILVFNKKGKFIRSIGSQGQGPGEYTHLHQFALDEKNKRLFVTSYNRKIICYDFNGKFLKETFFYVDIFNDINYFNDKLYLLVNNTKSDSKGIYSNSSIYKFNESLQIVDSCTIRDIYFESSDGYLFGHGAEDFILKGSKSIYLYYGDFFVRFNEGEKIFCDTLYRFEKNFLFPEFKLKFNNKSTNNLIDIYNIYRSTRYIFAAYYNNQYRTFFYFCFDTKTHKGYNMQDGYIDDIHQIEKPVKIRPFNLNTEMFYYLHTNMKPDDKEEPNPTLYIGKLKTKN